MKDIDLEYVLSTTLRPYAMYLGAPVYVTHDTSIGGFIRATISIPALDVAVYTKYIPENHYMPCLFTACVGIMNQEPDYIAELYTNEINTGFYFSHLNDALNYFSCGLDSSPQPEWTKAMRLLMTEGNIKFDLEKVINISGETRIKEVEE
jgi:hypothetical protein